MSFSSRFLEALAWMASLALLYWALGCLPPRVFSVVFPSIFACGIFLAVYLYSAELLIWHYRAKKADRKIQGLVENILSPLCEKSGILVPDLYVTRTAQANLFPVGRKTKRARLIMFDGLLDILKPEELSAVLAYGVTQIKKMPVGSLSFFAALSAMVGTVLFWAAGFFIRNNSSRGRGRKAPFVRGLRCVRMSFQAAVIRSAALPERIIKADQEASGLCGNPLYLASALARLQKRVYGIPFAEVKMEAAPLMIIYPLNPKEEMKVFKPQPSAYARIAALQNEALEKGLLPFPPRL